MTASSGIGEGKKIVARLVLVTPLKVPATHLRAVGYVLHRWAILESALEKTCWHLLGLPPKEGRLVFSQMNTVAKIRVYKALVDRLLQDGDDKTAAIEIAKKADALNIERNRIVHGSWGRV